MKKVYLYAQVDEAKCIGDRVCENVCPAGAIAMVNKKARVDPEKCLACLRCADSCGEDAIEFIPRASVLRAGVDPKTVDPAQIAELCARAGMDPEEPICLCTFTQAREVAAAILLGAASPDEVTRMTGVRSACGMWCAAPLLRLLNAAYPELAPARGYQWYNARAGLWDVSDEVCRQYPQYRLEEDRAVYCDKKVMDNMVFKMK